MPLTQPNEAGGYTRRAELIKPGKAPVSNFSDLLNFYHQSPGGGLT